MKSVDLYGRVRRAVLIDGMSRREAARIFGIDRRTVDKILKFSLPPGYRRTKPIKRPKLDLFVGIIDAILEADKCVPKKHTSKRVFERLRDEYGYTGGITIVKDYIYASKTALKAKAEETKTTRTCHTLHNPGQFRACQVLIIRPNQRGQYWTPMRGQSSKPIDKLGVTTFAPAVGGGVTLGVTTKSVSVKDLAYRWASCSADGKLNFHWKCMMATPMVIDYIVVHELCHMRVRDHSTAFWNEVDKILPDYLERKNWLKRYGAALDV